MNLRAPSLLAAVAISLLVGKSAIGATSVQGESQAPPSGSITPEWIVADAQQRYPGRVVDVEQEEGKFEVEICQENGRKVELEYSLHTGHLLDVDIHRFFNGCRRSKAAGAGDSPAR